jgi:hypothetical protein
MVERLRHLVVVIPGIGGSVLTTAERPVWDGGPGRTAASLLHPGRLDVTEHPDLVSVGLVPKIGFAGPLALPGYVGLVAGIRAGFRDVRTDTARHDRAIQDPRADLLLFPYDFRIGVRPAAVRLRDEIERRLDLLSGTERAKAGRVIVIAHSMGGLVARYWLGPLGGAGRGAALITLGTPHRGAAKALDWLVNGMVVGPMRFRKVTAVLRGWQSVYDLLPRYRMVAVTGSERPLYPHELPPDSVRHVPGFAARAADAFAMHEEIRVSWTDGAFPEITPIYGRGHGTLHRGRLDGARLTVEAADPDWLPNVGWAGDGTVPAISAIPIEMDDRRGAWRWTPGTHLELGSTPEAVQVLAAYTSPALSAVHGAEPQGPWLGIDLDDTVLADTPTPMGVRLLGVRPGPDTTVGALVAGHRISFRQVAEGIWEATLPSLPPGVYRVLVQAVRVPDAGRLTLTKTMGSVSPDEDDA